MDTREAIPGVWIERAAAIRDYADAGVATRWIASSLGIPQWLVREVLDQPATVAEAPTQPDAKAETVCQPTQQQQVTADAVSPADRSAPVIESGTQAEKGGDDHAGGRKSADSATKAPTRNDDVDAPYRLRDGAGVEAATADEAPAPAQLTDKQRAVYDAIAALEPARWRDLVRHTGMPHGKIGHRLEALQDKGLIYSQGSKYQRRFYIAKNVPAPEVGQPERKAGRAQPVLDQPVHRRCQACHAIFETQNVDEVFCTDCMNDPQAARLVEIERRRAAGHVVVDGDNMEAAE